MEGGVDRLWTTAVFHGGKKRGGGAGGRGAGDVHKLVHDVEKEGNTFHNRVDKWKKVWYNTGMKSPDLARCEEKMREKAPAFEAFFALLSEYNAKFNLTAVRERGEVWEKHFLDSLAGEYLFPQGARVAEVGSGAGFPSVPLMIVRDDLTFTLIESTGKKCNFLRTAVRELGLSATVECARAETLARDARFREKFDVCCARAVARLDTLAEYCLPFVGKGGRFVAYKGKDPETQTARGAIGILGGREAEAVHYLLPSAGERTLVLVEKERHTPPQYPRGQGKERSSPLS